MTTITPTYDAMPEVRARIVEAIDQQRRYLEAVRGYHGTEAEFATGVGHWKLLTDLAALDDLALPDVAALFCEVQP